MCCACLMTESSIKINEFESLLSNIVDQNNTVSVKVISSKLGLNQVDSKELLFDFVKYLLKTQFDDKVYACVCSSADSHSTDIPTIKIVFSSLKLSEISESKIRSIVSLQRSRTEEPFLYINTHFKENQDTNFYRKFFGLPVSEIIAHETLSEVDTNIKIYKEIEPTLSKTKQEKSQTDPSALKKRKYVSKSLKKQASQSDQVHEEFVACSDEDPIPKTTKVEDFPFFKETSSGKVRKRVLKDHKYPGADGFLITEKKYEYIDEEDTKPKSQPAPTINSSQKSTTGPKIQSSLTSFFKRTSNS